MTLLPWYRRMILQDHEYHDRLWPQSYHHATYFGGSICESGLLVHNSHRLQAQSYHHATYSSGSICESGLFWWKYMWKWLGGPLEPRLQVQSYHHATYSSGSICESGLSVHNSHRLQPQSYHHATYSGGSICEIVLSVHDSNKLSCRSMTATDCGHRAITMLLIFNMEVAAIVDR